MGGSKKPTLKVRFDRRVRLEFRGATINFSTVETSADRTTLITLPQETTGIGQLRKLFTKLETVKGVTAVVRMDVAASVRRQVGYGQ